MIMVRSIVRMTVERLAETVRLGMAMAVPCGFFAMRCDNLSHDGQLRRKCR